MHWLKPKVIFAYIYKNPVLSMVTGSIAGFVLTLFIFFFENLPFLGGDAIEVNQSLPKTITSAKDLLNAYPDFFTWIMLFTIHNGAAVALGIAAFLKLKMFKNFNIKKTEIVISLSLVLVMMIVSSTSYVIPFNSGHYYRWPIIPLNHQWLKIIVLLSISISAAGVSVLGLILAGCACIRLKEEQPDAKFKLYFELKEAMERFLMITGYILSSGMITVYFFMSTEEALGHPHDFDIHSLALFGLLFTVFIATTFIPCKLLLTDYGRSIVDSQLGKVPETVTDTKEWILTREEMEKYLQLKFDVIESIRYAIPVLAPILSAFLPAIFKLGK